MPASEPRSTRQLVVHKTSMVLASASQRPGVAAEFRYSTADPYAVMMAIRAQGTAVVVWTFARDLLSQGCSRPAGLGDVHIFPAGPHVVIDLSSTEGSARLIGRAASIRTFLQETELAVAVGEEDGHTDFDREFAGLALPSFAPRRDAP